MKKKRLGLGISTWGEPVVVLTPVRLAADRREPAMVPNPVKIAAVTVLVMFGISVTSPVAHATEVACDPTSPNNTCTGGTFGGIQDGSGFLSTVAGTSANGGGHLGVTVYGSSGTATGDFATAIGTGSSANTGAIAIGSGDPTGAALTTAGGVNSVAIGTTANSAGLNSIAIGTNATTTSNYAIAQGFGATAGAGGITGGGQPTGGIALGTGANAGTIAAGSSLAIGNYASATAPVATNTGDSVAIGTQTTANAVDSIAIGAQTTASAQNTIAIGNNGTANAGANSVVIGVASTASAAASGSVILGNNSTASAANETVIGRNASSTAVGGVALGNGSVQTRAGLAGGAEAFSGTTVASTNGSVSVGAAGAERQITNVAGGTQATDAVNVRQLRSVGTNLAGTLGGGAAFDPTTGAYTAPVYTVGGTNYNNVGAALTAGNALAVQYTPNGAGAPTNAVDLTKGGTLAPVALTGLANATAPTGAVALAQMPMQFSTVGAPTTANPAVPSNDVTLVGANAGAPVALHNVAAGAVTATSTDAVNGSQLRGFADNVDTLGTTTAAAIGGNSVYTPGTGITGTNYALNGAAAPFTNVVAGQQALANGAAGPVQYAVPGTPSNALNLVGTGGPVTLGNVGAGTLSATSTDAVNGSQLYATNQTVAGLANGTAGLVQQAGAGAPITVGAGTGGTVVDFANNTGAARTLTNVAGGNIALGSTQAINGGQLFGTAGSVATALGGGSVVNPDGTVSAPTYSVAGTNYSNVGGAIGALDAGLANGQVGAFRSDNTAGAAGPSATGANAVAGGFGSSATGAASTIIGNGATDNGVANSSVLGNGASITAGLTGSNVALGQGTVASRGARTNYAAFGLAATQSSVGEVAVGTAAAPRQLTGVAAGSADTDGVNVAQLRGTTSVLGTSVADRLGGGATYDPTTGTVTAPTYNVANGSYNDVGSALAALDNGIASGALSGVASNNSAGAAAPVATGADSTAVGFGSSARGARTAVLGNGATDNGVANSTVLGNGASIAAGATGSNVALGQGTTAARGAQTNYAAFGLAAPQTSAGEVAVGSAAAPRQLTGVAAGSAATDGVNVAQLQGATSNLGSSVASGLGGGSTYDPATGTVTAPSYSLNNGTVTATNVGDALTNLDGRTTSNTNAIAGLQNGTSGIVQQDQTTRAISVGASTDGTTVGFANNAGTARTLTGVAAGNVAAGSTQAVNGGQLYGTAGSVASALGGGSTVNSDGTLTAPSYTVGGTAYNNVGTAITALNNSGVRYDTVAGGGRGQSITLAGGDPNQPVVIRNVAAGTARTDAANFGQVQDAEASAKQYTNQRLAGLQNDMSGVNDRLSSLQSDVNQTKRDARSAAAVGLAAASLRFDDRPGKFSVAAGGGYWKGEGAAAWGLGYTLPDGNLRINATAATTGRDTGAGAGLSYTFN